MRKNTSNMDKNAKNDIYIVYRTNYITLPYMRWLLKNHLHFHNGWS